MPEVFEFFASLRIVQQSTIVAHTDNPTRYRELLTATGGSITAASPELAPSDETYSYTICSLDQQSVISYSIDLLLCELIADDSEDRYAGKIEN